MLDQRPLHPVGVGGVGDQDLGLGVGEAMPDAIVAVEDRHREENRSRLPGTEEGGRRLGRGRQQHRHAISASNAEPGQNIGEPVGCVLQLTPVELADVALEVLVDHGGLVARMAVADVGGDVVTLRHLPLVLSAGLFVRRDRAHRPIITDTVNRAVQHFG